MFTPPYLWMAQSDPEVFANIQAEWIAKNMKLD